MLDYRRLAHLSDEELVRHDIIDVHLACAAKLQGCQKIDTARCHKIIDNLVEWSKPYTAHILAKGRKLEPDDTEARIKVRAMIQVAWRGAGICYNPAKIPDDCVWELADSFVHGALYGDGGTCATLPVLYTALGRRLGYPIKLVTAWGRRWWHLFCRWEEPNGERFNIEANSTGVRFPSDDHYREQGLTPLVEKQGLFLKSKTPRQELATFLGSRAQRLHDSARLRECVDAYAWASGLSPDDEILLDTLKLRYNDWLDEIKSRQPPGFPKVWLSVLQRRYPSALPLRMEQNILCLETIDSLLRDPEAETRFWRPLREGSRVARPPQEVNVETFPDKLTVGLRFANSN